MRSLRLTLRMIKFEHTLFALPFAVLSLLVATDGTPPLSILFWVLVAMVGARSTAMAFNRLVDAAIDARNPRTQLRELPAGLLGRGFVFGFTLAMAALFVLAAARLNPLCFALSPIALGVVWAYSFTKRFTWLSHAVLGLGLAIAPVGAWLAATGEFAPFPLWLAAAVLSWVAGFDILYACQDESFDRDAGLYSIPAKLGTGAAIWIARTLHVGAVLLWLVAAVQAQLGWFARAGVAAAALLLAYEHWLVRGGDLRHIDRAFFTLNGYVGLVLLAFFAAEVYLSP
jgi:4-hydroxybenzoate polyprenyltransferase